MGVFLEFIFFFWVACFIIGRSVLRVCKEGDYDDHDD